MTVLVLLCSLYQLNMSSSVVVYVNRVEFCNSTLRIISNNYKTKTVERVKGVDQIAEIAFILMSINLISKNKVEPINFLHTG